MARPTSLPHQLGVVVQLIEQVPGGGQQIDLVDRDQGSYGQGVLLDEADGSPVRLGGVVTAKIDTLESAVAQMQVLRPLGEHPHDGGLSGGYADEIEGRFVGLPKASLRHSPSSPLSSYRNIRSQLN
jgi:hypothetical protein